MKKLALLVSMFVLVALFSSLHAQDYKSAIGLRLGYPLSATYKFFLNEEDAIELYAGYRGYSGVYSYWNIGGQYEVHKPFPDVEHLHWFFGGGASVLFFSYDFNGSDGTTGLGVNGVIGLDYKFESAPINLSVDFMPTIRFGGFDDGFTAWGAFSARYVLK